MRLKLSSAPLKLQTSFQPFPVWLFSCVYSVIHVYRARWNAMSWKIRKTKQEELRYSSHLDNYRFCSFSRIIPTCLQINCTPALGNLPPPLQRKWNQMQILHGTSIILINVLIEHCTSSLDSFSAEITQLEHKLQPCSVGQI